MIKKFLSVLCLLIVVRLMMIPIVASATSSFRTSKSTVGAGDTFVVTVNIGSADDVGRIGIIPAYDKNAFEFVSGSWLIEGVLSEADITKNGAAIIAFSNSTDLNGDIYSFTLRVKESVRGGTYEIGGIVNTGSAISVTSTNIDVEVAGVSVFGQVTTYNPKNETLIELLQDGDVVYRTVISATDGDGVITQEFEITGVVAGEYDLKVTKLYHLEYKIVGITVDSEPVDLRYYENKQVADMVLISGDVNDDGCVDLKDVVQLTSTTTYSQSFENAETKSADINGDRCFDLKDLVIITSAKNYGKTKIIVEY